MSCTTIPQQNMAANWIHQAIQAHVIACKQARMPRHHMTRAGMFASIAHFSSIIIIRRMMERLRNQSERQPDHNRGTDSRNATGKPRQNSLNSRARLHHHHPQHNRQTPNATQQQTTRQHTMQPSRYRRGGPRRRQPLQTTKMAQTASTKMKMPTPNTQPATALMRKCPCPAQQPHLPIVRRATDMRTIAPILDLVFMHAHTAVTDIAERA